MKLREECGGASPGGPALAVGRPHGLRSSGRRGVLATRAASLTCDFCSSLNVSVPLPLMPGGQGRTWLLSQKPPFLLKDHVLLLSLLKWTPQKEYGISLLWYGRNTNSKSKLEAPLRGKHSWLKFPAPWKNQERKVSGLHQSWLIGTLNLELQPLCISLDFPGSSDGKSVCL